MFSIRIGLKIIFFVPGDGKSLVSLNITNSKNLIIASQNNDSLKIFESRQNFRNQLIKLKDNEVKAEIVYHNGTKQIQEFYWGSSFQSQSSRYVTLRPGVREIRLFDNFGTKTRIIPLSPMLNIDSTRSATRP